MPPTGQITSIKLAVAIYCLKMSVFNVYNNSTTGSANVMQDEAPGAWITVLDNNTFAVISEGGRPPTNVKLFSDTNREGDLFTLSANRMIDGSDIVAFFNENTSISNITDGAGNNTKWGQITIGTSTYAIPLLHNTSPLWLRYWANIGYTVEGQTATASNVVAQEIKLYSLNNYYINSTFKLKRIPTDANNAFYQLDNWGTPAASLNQATIAGMKIVYRMFDLNSTEIGRMLDREGGVRALDIGYIWSKANDPTKYYAQLSVPDVIKTQEQKTSYQDERSFHLSSLTSTNAKYFPHCHTEIIMQAGDTPQFPPLPNAPINQYDLIFHDGNSTVTPASVKPAIVVKDQTGTNQMGAASYSTIYIEAGSEVPFTQSVTTISIPKLTSMFYGHPSNQKTFKIKITAGVLPVTVNRNGIHVEIPIGAQDKYHYVYSNGKWRQHVGNNQYPVILRTILSNQGEMVIQENGGLAGQATLEIPLNLVNTQNDQTASEVFGQWPLTQPTAIRVIYHMPYKVGSGQYIDIAKEGWLYLNMESLITTEVVNLTQSPTNDTVITGITLKTTKKVADKRHFNLSSEILGGTSGYYMADQPGHNKLKITSMDGNGTAIMIRTALGTTDHLEYENLVQYQHSKIVETHVFDPTATVSIQTSSPGSNTLEIQVPEDLPTTGIQGSISYLTMYNTVYLIGQPTSLIITNKHDLNTDNNFVFGVDLTLNT